MRKQERKKKEKKLLNKKKENHESLFPTFAPSPFHFLFNLNSVPEFPIVFL